MLKLFKISLFHGGVAVKAVWIEEVVGSGFDFWCRWQPPDLISMRIPEALAWVVCFCFLLFGLGDLVIGCLFKNERISEIIH